MGASGTTLADLLTAAGSAVAAANARLAAAGAPALLREASLTLDFNAPIAVRPDDILLTRVARPGVQQLALAGRTGRMDNTRLSVTFVAAPAVRGPAP